MVAPILALLWTLGASVDGHAQSSTPTVAPPPIRGTVCDPQGLPIPNALITLRIRLAYETTLDNEYPDELPYGTFPAIYLGVHTRTDTHGHFRLMIQDSLWHRPQRFGTDSVRELLVLAEGYTPAAISLAATDTLTTVHLTPETWTQLTYKLRDPEGHPVAGAEVQFRAATGIVEHTISGSDGQWRLTVPPQYRNTIVVDKHGFRPTELILAVAEPLRTTATITLRRSITGVVVDRRGHPVPDALISVGPLSRLDRPFRPFRTHDTLRTDKHGRFTLAPVFIPQVSGIMTHQPEMTLQLQTIAPNDTDGAVVQIPDRVLASATPLAVLRLAPVADVEFIFHPGPKADTLSPPTIAMISRQTPADDWEPYELNIPIIKQATTSPSFLARTRLAPGAYRLTFSGDFHDTIPFTIRPIGGFIRIPASVAMTRSIPKAGMLAPALHAHDLAGRPADLRMWRDTVVILDFWGFWCGACIAELPSLIQRQQHYIALGLPVKVIVVHDASLRTRAEYDSIAKPVLAHSIHQTELPLLVLLDTPLPDEVQQSLEDRLEGHGVTVRDYAFEGFPGTFVIDPSGRMVGRAQTLQHLDPLVQQALQMLPTHSATH